MTLRNAPPPLVSLPAQRNGSFRRGQDFEIGERAAIEPYQLIRVNSSSRLTIPPRKETRLISLTPRFTT